MEFSIFTIFENMPQIVYEIQLLRHTYKEHHGITFIGFVMALLYHSTIENYQKRVY